jgi:hypothetical protein
VNNIVIPADIASLLSCDITAGILPAAMFAAGITAGITASRIDIIFGSNLCVYLQPIFPASASALSFSFHVYFYHI